MACQPTERLQHVRLFNSFRLLGLTFSDSGGFTEHVNTSIIVDFQRFFTKVRKYTITC